MSVFLMIFLLSVSLTVSAHALYPGNVEGIVYREANSPITSLHKVYFTLKSFSWVRFPGMKNGLAVIRISVVYYGTDILLDVQEILRLSCSCEVVSEQPVKLGSWEPGTTKVVDFTVNVTGFPEKCYATLNIQYKAVARRTQTGYNILSFAGGGSLGFMINYPEYPQLSYYISPTTLRKDAVNLVTITFVNTGTGTVQDLVTKITVNGATLIESFQPIRLRIGKLEPDSNYTLRIKLIPISGQVTLSIDVDYIGTSEQPYNEKFSTTLSAVSTTSVILTAEPSKIRTGSSGEIKIKIINLGDTVLSNVVLHLRPSQGSKLVISPTLFFIGKVEPGQTREAEVELNIPNTVTGTQTLQYTLIYDSGSSEKNQLSGTISIFAVERAQLTITSTEVVPQEPIIGQTVIVSITLINLGSQPLGKINVTTYYSEGLKPLRQTSYFMGQLQPQVPTSIPFSFKSSKTGTQRIDFVITFSDIYGLNWTITKTIELNIKESSKTPSSGKNIKGRSSSNFSYVSYILVAIVILTILYIIYRKVYGGRK